MRGSPSGRAVKVPLFPGLSASAIKVSLLDSWLQGGREGETQENKQAGWSWGLAEDREEAVRGFVGQSTVFLPDLSLCPQAKLRGRNRSAEEGMSSGDSKGTPPKDPHVQRSKSCKIPGMSGKPPTLPPKPEKSSG